MELNDSASENNPEQRSPAPAPQPMIIPSQKTFPWIPLLFMLVILLASGMAYFFIQNRNLNSQLTSSASPAPASSPVAASDPTEGWKEYANTKQNIFFSYPPAWDLTETKGDLENGQVLNQNVTLSLSPASISMNFNMVGIGGSGMDLEGDPFILDGLKLYKYSSDRDNGTTLIGLTDTLQESLGVFQANGKTYSISLVIPQKSQDNSFEADFDQILSTFRFSNNESGSGEYQGWQSYSDPKMALSLKYPEDWRAMEFEGGVGFGPEGMGDTLNAVQYFDKSVFTLQSVMSQMGEQFADRKVVTEDIKVGDSETAKRVVVTTATIPDWYYESIIFNGPTHYIMVGNGAIKDENLDSIDGVPTGFTFKKFYSTVRLD